MVTAPQTLAAKAGASVLADGGNAIEAMIASAATIAVTYPHMNSIGGDGFWLIAVPGKAPVGVRACGPAAARATKEFYAEHDCDAIPTRGPLAALTVAGAVAGWIEADRIAKEQGGTIPIARLLEDAIHHARDGIPVSRSQAELTESKWDGLKDAPGFADVFAPDGLPRQGHDFSQSELGDSLQQLSDAGLDDFYRGDMARKLAEGMEKVGSPVALNDLEQFCALRVPPVLLNHSAGDVFNMPPPTQGVSSLLILAIFDALRVTEPESFDHIHGLVEATKQSFILRNAHVGDPAYVGDEWKRWLEPNRFRALADAIDMAKAAPWPQPASPGDTIWMGAADKNGIVVSYIQSIFWEFGSGVVVPGTGIVWQNRGASFTLTPSANELAPGRLPFHTLNPALARLDDGRTLAYGTMGGDGQPQTQSAIFTRYVCFGQDMQEAVSAPRWLLGRTWGEDSTNLKLENRFDPALIEALKSAGHDVQVVGDYEDMMGHAGMICFHEKDGTISGATDPRADGSCETSG